MIEFDLQKMRIFFENAMWSILVMKLGSNVWDVPHSTWHQFAFSQCLFCWEILFSLYFTNLQWHLSLFVASEHFVCLRLNPKASWIVSNWTHLPIALLMFRLFTPNDLTTPLLLLTNWLVAKMQTMSLPMISCVFWNPSKWIVKPDLKLPKIFELYLIESRCLSTHESYLWQGDASWTFQMLFVAKQYPIPSFVL